MIRPMALACFLSSHRCDLLCFPLLLQLFSILALFSFSHVVVKVENKVFVFVCVIAYSYSVGKRVSDCKNV